MCTEIVKTFRMDVGSKLLGFDIGSRTLFSITL